jgi:hypothetical protein
MQAGAAAIEQLKEMKMPNNEYSDRLNADLPTFRLKGHPPYVPRQTVIEAVLAERERCAKLCETLDHGAFGAPSYLAGIEDGAKGCANAIRKGETP